MIEVGRLCVKIAGREAGRKCVVVEVIDSNYAVIDGDVKRRKCNISHLEPLDKKIEMKNGALHGDVVDELKKLGIDIKETKKKEKTEKPKKSGRKKRTKAISEGKKKADGKKENAKGPKEGKTEKTEKKKADAKT